MKKVTTIINCSIETTIVSISDKKVEHNRIVMIPYTKGKISSV